MAQVFAPGVAQLRLVGKIGVNAQAQVLHYYGGTTAAWTQAQIDALATNAFTALGAHLTPLMSGNVTYDFAEAVDLTDAVERVSQTTVPPKIGTGLAPWPPLSASVMMSHRIGSRYRGGHPRTYFPPPPIAYTSDSDTWTSAFVSDFQTAYDAFDSQIVSALLTAGLIGPVQCAPRYVYTYTADATKHKFVKERTAFIGPFPIVTSVCSSQIRSQRRRLGP